MLRALASFGAFDVVVNRSADADGEWLRYVTSLEGVVLLARDVNGAAYRVPAAPNPDVELGERLPITSARAYRHEPGNMIDGRLETAWWDDPQHPDQWVAVDLGTIRDVGGVTEALADHSWDFPRRLAIDLSTDGVTWTEVWEGRTVAQAFRASALQPANAELRFAFSPRPARFVRLRQLAEHRTFWWIAELRVHAPVVSKF